MNGFLFAAAIASLLTFLLHLFVGGRGVAKPLLNASGIEEVTKLTTYYCWHIVTVVLLIMTCAFAYVALLQFDLPLTIVMTSMAGSCTLLSIGLILVRKLKPLDYPQWIFFLPMTVLGVLGLLSA